MEKYSEESAVSDKETAEDTPLHRLEYLVIISFVSFVNAVPFGAALWIARQVGKILFVIMWKKRAIALDNLTHAFAKEKSKSEIRQLAVESFQNMCMFFVEFIRIPIINKELEKYVTINHPEIVWQALEKGKGVLLLISHMGNWELMATMAGRIGYPIFALGRPMKNKFVYEAIRQLRSHTGLANIDIDRHNIGRTALKIMRKIKSNSVIAILIDQHFWGKTGSVWVDFFGREASTTTFPAQLALSTGCVVVPVFCLRDGKERYSIDVHDPVELAATGNAKKDVYNATQDFTKIIEDEIRKYPGQWLWLHKRWKPRPLTDKPNP